MWSFLGIVVLAVMIIMFVAIVVIMLMGGLVIILCDPDVPTWVCIVAAIAIILVCGSAISLAMQYG